MNIQRHQTFVKCQSKPICDAWFLSYGSICWKVHLIFIIVKCFYTIIIIRNEPHKTYGWSEKWVIAKNKVRTFQSHMCSNFVLKKGYFFRKNKGGIFWFNFFSVASRVLTKKKTAVVKESFQREYIAKNNCRLSFYDIFFCSLSRRRAAHRSLFFREPTERKYRNFSKCVLLTETRGGL